jgi:hypothetical protein
MNQTVLLTGVILWASAKLPQGPCPPKGGTWSAGWLALAERAPDLKFARFLLTYLQSG